MAPVKHGAYVNGKPTKLYRVWLTMRSRCNNPKVDHYHRYGGRGIKVCARWDDFSLFKEDMGDAPGLGYSLDRFPNADGDYEPGNVRWATKEQQANNRSNNHLILLPDGRRMSVSLAAREMGISFFVLRGRLRMGWSEDRLFEAVDPEGGRIKKGEIHRRWG